MVRCLRLVIHLPTMVARHTWVVTAHIWMVASRTGRMETHTVVVAVLRWMGASLDTLDRWSVQLVVAQDLVAWCNLVARHLVDLGISLDLVDTLVATLVARSLGNSLETQVVVVVVRGVAVEVATPRLDEFYATGVVMQATSPPSAM